MADLRTALTEALSQAEEGTIETVVETPIETATPDPIAVEAAEAKAERDRDQQGRFVPKTAAAPAAPVVPAVEARKPPSSWKKDHWDRWARLASDPELAPLQEYIESREQDYAKGVSTYKGQWDQAEPVMRVLGPLIPDLQRAGITPDRYIAGLAQTDRMLTNGTPEQKLQALTHLATRLGINVGALNGGPVDPQYGHMTQTVNALQNRLQQFETQQQQSQQQALQRQIDDFAATAPHFEALKPEMAKLLSSGMAPDLKTAYQKAMRLNDEVWQQEQAAQAKAAEAQRQQELARKKAAAVSPRSASPTGSAVVGNAKKGLRDTLESNFDAVASGRF